MPFHPSYRKLSWCSVLCALIAFVLIGVGFWDIHTDHLISALFKVSAATAFLLFALLMKGHERR